MLFTVCSEIKDETIRKIQTDNVNHRSEVKFIDRNFKFQTRIDQRFLNVSDKYKNKQDRL